MRDLSRWNEWRIVGCTTLHFSILTEEAWLFIQGGNGSERQVHADITQ